MSEICRVWSFSLRMGGIFLSLKMGGLSWLLHDKYVSEFHDEFMHKNRRCTMFVHGTKTTKDADSVVFSCDVNLVANTEDRH